MRHGGHGPVLVGVLAIALLPGCSGDGDPTGGITAPPPRSDFEFPVSLPACDTADPTVRLLQQDSDWEDINSEDYRIFCVAPGDYSALGDVRLARDGTAEAPRYLRYFDPANPDDDRHPAQQSEAERAILAGMRVTDARHWVVDRITVTGDWERILFEEASDHNVLNRVLLDSAAVVVRHGCHDNTIQNSVLRNAPKTPGGDRVCMVLSGSNDGADVAIHGTHVINNEIYDCTDSIQAYRVDESGNVIDFGGTVIDNNDLYVTDGMYTDCEGNMDPQGACSCAENAVDLKAAGDGLDHIIQVSNNRMWGFKPTDTACGGTGSGGAASVVHMTARYTLYQGNIIWDVPRAMTFLNDHHTAIDNLVYSVHRGDNDGTAIYPDGPNCEIYRNVIIDVDRWVAAYGNEGDYRCNVLIEAGRNTAAGENLQADYNFYYDAEPMELPGDHDIVAEQAADAMHTELCFTVRPWTGPEEVCIPHGAPTEASPHHGACDPALCHRPAVGVHDQPW